MDERKPDNLHLTVAAVVEQHDRFLVVEELVHGEKVINQPAGHVEANETLINAAIREVNEETAWHFKPKAITGVYLWTHPESGERFLRIVFCGTVHDHDALQSLDAGIIRALWLSRHELARREALLRSPMVLQAIDDFHNGSRYPLTMFGHIDLDELTGEAKVV
ncbi:MAG: NUDIX hydrolase [Gammaproteobacteria bacterium]